MVSNTANVMACILNNTRRDFIIISFLKICVTVKMFIEIVIEIFIMIDIMMRLK